MDLIKTRDNLIEQQINHAREEYPSLWREVIQSWNHDEAGDALWLTYAANYLFRTGGMRWALDPFSMSSRVPGVEQPDYARDLAKCKLFVLSHKHADHLDLNLVKAMQDLPVRWVIPAYMLELIHDTALIPDERITVPQYGEPMQFDGLRLTPFKGLHINGGRGVPSTGYLAEWAGKRWLIPGDTRVYDRSQLPDFGHLDGVIAHLWLGRGKALEERPTLLDDFCRFFASFDTRRILVTHLQEFGRATDDYWDRDHFDRVQPELLKLRPGLDISCALMGEKVTI